MYIFTYVFRHFFLNQIFGLFLSQTPQYVQKVDWISAAAHAIRAQGTELTGDAGCQCHTVLSHGKWFNVETT